jgi:GNAT superfamily N-acetyltransferase
VEEACADHVARVKHLAAVELHDGALAEALGRQVAGEEVQRDEEHRQGEKTTRASMGAPSSRRMHPRPGRQRPTLELEPTDHPLSVESRWRRSTRLPRQVDGRTLGGPNEIPMQSREPVVIQADLDRPDHRGAVVAMTAAYALDEMGNGGPLPQDVLDRLIPALRSHPTTLVLLAYVDAAAVGIATCFVGFSTFAARPLVNVHDLSVLPEHRGRGVGRALLRGVERAARERGCVKVTLEVQENNHRARRAYESAGLTQAGSGGPTGGALFYSKSLD